MRTISTADSISVLHVPLIGITTISSPQTLPNKGGKVTFNYAVKNFLKETPLTNITVVDDTCSPVRYLTGDDNRNSKLDYDETWRYSCIINLLKSTQSTATVTGMANSITATHRSRATVLIGSNVIAPSVSIVNITKVTSPLVLSKNGEKITYVYKVNNPGNTPLDQVVVTASNCDTMSGKLGDTNGNGLLDINEVWIYTCTTNIKHTTTNTAHVTAHANGLKAESDTSLTIEAVPYSYQSEVLYTVLLVAVFILFIFWKKKWISKH